MSASGLESIALAVAQLEERKPASEPNPPLASFSAGSPVGLSSPPAGTAFGASTAARIVSTDTVSSSSPSCPSKAPAPFTSSLDVIIADPAAWLNSRTDFPPVPPPSEATVITEVCQDDVLCGRGGETNHHPGNIQYRNLVKAFRPLYIEAKRRDKPKIATCIVHAVRSKGGRFLKRTADPKTWKDVGNTKAREKTSQALREGAPEMRGTDKPVSPQQQEQPHQELTPQQRRISSPPSTSTPTLSMPTVMTSPMYTPHHHPAFQGHNPFLPLFTSLPQVMGSAMARSSFQAPLVTPVPSRKRPSYAAMISDEDASDASHDATATTTGNTSAKKLGGPRLKRLKQRLEMEERDCNHFYC